jgi:ATP-dependent helicase/DNAse subunit B
LGLKEKEDLWDEPEGKDIGTFIHELLCEEFSPFVGKRPRIDTGFQKTFFEALDKNFSESFERKMKSDAFLVKEMVRFIMKKFLDNERDRPVAEIVSLESEFSGKLELASGSFVCKAIVDRIDRLPDSSLLILDYKTGGASIMPEIDAGKIQEAGFSRKALKETVKSFQLPLYLYLVGQNKRYHGQQLNACLYFVKEIEKEDKGLHELFRSAQHWKDKDKIMGVYLKAIDALINELLDPSVPFEADEEDARLCQYCQYFYLCR